eukprot:4848391-Pleurochrysis_carterae.AAC.3
MRGVLSLRPPPPGSPGVKLLGCARGPNSQHGLCGETEISKSFAYPPPCDLQNTEVHRMQPDMMCQCSYLKVPYKARGTTQTLTAIACGRGRDKRYRVVGPG